MSSSDDCENAKFPYEITSIDSEINTRILKDFRGKSVAVETRHTNFIPVHYRQKGGFHSGGTEKVLFHETLRQIRRRILQFSSAIWWRVDCDVPTIGHNIDPRAHLAHFQRLRFWTGEEYTSDGAIPVLRVNTSSINFILFPSSRILLIQVMFGGRRQMEGRNIQSELRRSRWNQFLRRIVYASSRNSRHNQIATFH